MTKFKKGDIVLYSPSDLPDTPPFGAVVASEPRVIDGTLLCRLEGLDKTYKRGQTIVPEAVVDRLELAPTVYCSGQEHTPDGWHVREHIFEDEYDGEIAYEAGKWLWWAMGIPGKSNSYESARLAAEEIVREEIRESK